MKYTLKMLDNYNYSVTNTYSRHGYQSPPVSIKHCEKCCIGAVILKDINQGGEDEDAHEKKQKQHAQLSI